MKILVIGGSRYFGIHMVNKLLEQGHEVTIATRGKTPDSYGDKVERITIQRTNEESMREALQGKHFDVVIDKIAYCSNDIRYVMDYVDCDKYIYMSILNDYLHWYNEKRIKKSLGYLSPMEYRHRLGLVT